MRTSARAGTSKRELAATPPSSSARPSARASDAAATRTTRASRLDTRVIIACRGRLSREPSMWAARIRRLLARALITLALVESAWLAYPRVRARVLAREDTPAARGWRVAARLG